MKTTKFFYRGFHTLLIVGLLVAFTSCEKETEDDSPAAAPTMGDPKSSSPAGSQCYEIALFTDDGINETDDYSNIRFEFVNNGVVIARSSDQEWEGQWSLGSDDGVQKFFLNFSGTIPLLNELTDDWNVVSLSNGMPSFIEDGLNPDQLQFTHSTCAPSGGGSNPELTEFNSNLVGDPWFIESFIDDGQNEASDYNNVSFTFNADGTVAAQRNNQSATGLWASSFDDGQIELLIQFSGPGLLNDLNEDWDVISFTTEELQLEDVSPGDSDFITFSHTPGGGGGSNPELVDFNSNLVGEPWTISSFIDDGQNETNDYNNVTFTFNEDGSVVAQKFNQSRTGSWSTSIDGGQIELEIGFTGPALLNELNEDWDVISSSGTQLELEDIGPGDNDLLTFSRN